MDVEDVRLVAGHGVELVGGGARQPFGAARHRIHEIALAEKDEPEIYKTGEAPAIYLNFDEISLPPPAEQPQIEGLDFSNSSISQIMFDDEIAAQNTPSHPTSAGSE